MSVPVLSRSLIATERARVPPKKGDARAPAPKSMGSGRVRAHASRGGARARMLSGRLPGSSRREARAEPQARAPLSRRARFLTPHAAVVTAQPGRSLARSRIPRAQPLPQTKALGPTLRANPCPEVTDPFCRLPLPTLSHWPEAFHLGDLMRL